MKIRYGFVTNSSSSSFIISKERNFNSVDEVFQFLKILHKEYLEKRKELIEYCKSDNRFLVTEENGKTSIAIAEKKIPHQEWMRIKNEIENRFGMLWYDISYGNIEWLNCKTYSDFLEYAKNNYLYINIVDMLNPTFSEESEFDSSTSLIQWYMPCFESIYTNDCNCCSQN